MLLSDSSAVSEEDGSAMRAMASQAKERYCQVMSDIEYLINDHILLQNRGVTSKLKLLVPSIGTFFTPLPLRDAFSFQDQRRRISSRRFVAPSFNDIRLILNTAQAMSLVKAKNLELITFDGDVTLYDDGECLTPDNPCIPRLLKLLDCGIRIAIVTAAGYTRAENYYERLHGLLDAVAKSDRSGKLENKLVIMGGEANFLFAYTSQSTTRLKFVPPSVWQLPEMIDWKEEQIVTLLDTAEAALRECVECMQIPVTVLRKERAVGIFPPKGIKLPREQLEETVLVTQRKLEHSAAGSHIPFCAFNGGNDIFVDIGDKSWGVRACQRYFGGIEPAKSLHVGDQFLSAGANDFKARQAATTCWIASPTETVSLLDEIIELNGANE